MIGQARGQAFSKQGGEHPPEPTVAVSCMPEALAQDNEQCNDVEQNHSQPRIAAVEKGRAGNWREPDLFTQPGHGGDRRPLHTLLVKNNR